MVVVVVRVPIHGGACVRRACVGLARVAAQMLLLVLRQLVHRGTQHGHDF
jgi:hypothetical protein